MRIRNKPWARKELSECGFFIDEPKDLKGKWKNSFSNNNPVHLDLGCGKGVFLKQAVVLNPEINYIGIDINYSILGLAKRNVEESSEAPFGNIRLTYHNIADIDQILNENDGVERIYINFCNPWHKGQHQKRRLTHIRQLEKYKKILKKSGEIRFKTDDTLLFKATKNYFDHAGLFIDYITEDLSNSGIPDNVQTEHELMFIKEGIAIKYIKAIYISQ